MQRDVGLIAGFGRGARIWPIDTNIVGMIDPVAGWCRAQDRDKPKPPERFSFGRQSGKRIISSLIVSVELDISSLPAYSSASLQTRMFD